MKTETREEIDILKIVAENPSISQRKISVQTGISLGQVNFLIKKCVKKGWIKIEGQTAKSLRYNVTPKGFAEKAEKTRQYFKLSIDAVLKLTDKMKEMETTYERQGKIISVVGEEDELMRLARLALKKEAFENRTGDNVVILNTRDFI